MYALLMLSNSLKMIKTDQNMSEFWWTVCDISACVVLLCQFIKTYCRIVLTAAVCITQVGTCPV